MAASSISLVMTACGAQGTPADSKCAFSTARSWQTATEAAAGATTRMPASVASATAGTFSNSVVMASQSRASWARPTGSR